MGKLIMFFVALTTVIISVVDARNRGQKGSNAPAPSSPGTPPPPSMRAALNEAMQPENWPPAAPIRKRKNRTSNNNYPRWKTAPLIINMENGEPVLAPTEYEGKTIAPRESRRKDPSQLKKRKGGPTNPTSQGEIGGSSSSGQSAGAKRLPSLAKHDCKSGTEQISIYEYNFDSHNPNQHPDQYTSRHQNPHPDYPFTNTNPGQYPFGYPSTNAFSTNQPFPPTFSSNTNLERYSQPGQYTSGYPQPNTGYPCTNAFTTPPTLPSSSVPDCTLDQYIGMGLRYNQIKTKWLTPAERRRLEELKPQLSTPTPSPLLFNNDEYEPFVTM